MKIGVERHESRHVFLVLLHLRHDIAQPGDVRIRCLRGRELDDLDLQDGAHLVQMVNGGVLALQQPPKRLDQRLARHLAHGCALTRGGSPAAPWR